MQKTKTALQTFIYKVRNVVFELLSLLYREEAVGEKVELLLLLTLFRLKVSIDTNKSSHSSNVVVSESFQELQNAQLAWFGPDIQ
jgi:hypothetical protein